MTELEIEIRARRQFLGLLESAKRWAICVAHRRAGKTVACVQKLVKGALECARIEPRFAYVAPLYRQAKDVAWSYVKRLTLPLGGEPNEAELRVDLPTGARIRLYGADNPDSLRGIYLDGVVLDEYADMRPSVWGEIIRPMLSDRQGWAAFIGTPKGRNEFYQLWERALADSDWFHVMLRASESGLLPEAELLDARRTMTPEQYEQEYECSFEAAIVGAYFGKEMAQAEREGRIRHVPYEPQLPVHTAWDLGIGDSTAIWCFQVVGDEIRVIDHYETHGQGLAHYAGQLSAMGYQYGKDFVPHDARVKELGTGRTRVETLIALGRKPDLVPNHKIMDGVNAARLAIPRCYFDREKCAEGMEALRQYRAEYDEKLRTFKNEPRHDWSSHSADAFRYLAMAYREMRAEPPKREEPRFFPNVTAAEVFALDKPEEQKREWV